MKTKTLLIDEATGVFATYSHLLAREEILPISKLAGVVRRFVTAGYVVKVAKRPGIEGNLPALTPEEIRRYGQVEQESWTQTPDPERKAP